MNRLEPLQILLAGTSLIEASAGTGKTYTITTLYLRLLLERATLAVKLGGTALGAELLLELGAARAVAARAAFARAAVAQLDRHQAILARRVSRRVGWNHLESLSCCGGRSLQLGARVRLCCTRLAKAGRVVPCRLRRDVILRLHRTRRDRAALTLVLSAALDGVGPTVERRAGDV